MLDLFPMIQLQKTLRPCEFSTLCYDSDIQFIREGNFSITFLGRKPPGIPTTFVPREALVFTDSSPNPVTDSLCIQRCGSEKLCISLAELAAALRGASSTHMYIALFVHSACWCWFYQICVHYLWQYMVWKVERNRGTMRRGRDIAASPRR